MMGIVLEGYCNYERNQESMGPVRGILIFIEQREEQIENISLEVLTKRRQLAKQLGRKVNAVTF